MRASRGPSSSRGRARWRLRGLRALLRLQSEDAAAAALAQGGVQGDDRRAVRALRLQAVCVVLSSGVVLLLAAQTCEVVMLQRPTTPAIIFFPAC